MSSSERHTRYALVTGVQTCALPIFGQVDPDSMVNCTVSGELVFVTILSGAGGVAAPFVGSMIYELIRTYAFEWLPHAWQLIVGAMLLGIIFFLPDGLWSLPRRIRRWRGEPGRGPA